MKNEKKRLDVLLFITLLISPVLLTGACYYFLEIYNGSYLYASLYEFSIPHVRNESYVQIISIIVSTFIICFLSLLLMLYDRKYYASVISYGLSLILAAYLVYGESKNVYYDYSTGNAYKYYIQTMQGYEHYKSPDFNQVYNIYVKKITSETVKNMKRIDDLGMKPPYESIPYYDKHGKRIETWYSWNDGNIESFLLPGLDPNTHEKLKPTTITEYYQLREKSEYYISKKMAEVITDALKAEEAERKSLIELQKREKKDFTQLLDEFRNSEDWRNIDDVRYPINSDCVRVKNIKSQYAYEVDSSVKVCIKSIYIEKPNFAVHFEYESLMNYSNLSNVINDYSAFQLYDSNEGLYFPEKITSSKTYAGKIRKGEKIDYIALFIIPDMEAINFQTGGFTLFSRSRWRNLVSPVNINYDLGGK